MEQNNQATTKGTDATTHQKHFTVFDLFPILVALAIAAFSADYTATRFGTLASVAAFVIVSVLGFLAVGYAFHLLYGFGSWLRRVVSRHR
jgi:hypothetical protein